MEGLAQENGRETLERTLRDVAHGGKSVTATEQMVAALALCELLEEVIPSPVQRLLALAAGGRRASQGG